MSDVKKHTDRDMVLAHRAGWMSCASWTDVQFGGAMLGESRRAYRREVEGAGDKTFPLPKVARPRVVADPIVPEYAWRVLDGVLQMRWVAGDAPWINWQETTLAMREPHPKRVAVWADLYADPTEEAEAES